MSSIPEQLRYTDEHEWVRVEGDELVIGVTDHAQEQLGDVVYVDLPPVGAGMGAGAVFGEIESTKSVSDLFAPVAGTVSARNDALEDRPELVNADCYGEGWLLRIAPSDPSAVEGLLDAEAYGGLVS